MNHSLPARAGKALTAFAVAIASAQAGATLLVNGDFEAGDFSGWTQTGDTDFTGVDGFAPQAGSFGAFFGNVAPGGIMQTLATTAGTVYRVEFWLQLADDSAPTHFAWSWDGVQQAALSDAAAFAYSPFTAELTASGASTVLAFEFRHPAAFWDLDSISVSIVPEPGTPALWLAGSALLLTARRGLRR